MSALWKLNRDYLVGLLVVTISLSLLSLSLNLWAGMQISGQVNYRRGADKKLIPDQGANVWLFSGEQHLAIEAANKLVNFEKAFPEGGTEIAHRPLEEEARKAGIVLMTYAHIHREALLNSTTVNKKGIFALTWTSSTPITLVIESATVYGSFHLKRYYVKSLKADNEVKEINVDFGVSHLEGHQ